jgi:DNA-binding GntR family transcriptional regulator
MMQMDSDGFANNPVECLLLSKKTNVEKAFRYIRCLILDSSLKPGANIKDTDIAQKLGISRTPVREALRRLELEGLILNVPYRGWTVRTLQVEDVAEIFEIKEALEAALVRQATPNLTADDKVRLAECVSRMEEAAETEDREAFLMADDSFHDALYQAASNRRAKQILSSINAQWRWVRVGLVGLLGGMSQAAAEHRAILDRVLTGDGEGAAVAMVQGVSRVKQYLLSVLNNLAVPFAATMERR